MYLGPSKMLLGTGDMDTSNVQYTYTVSTVKATEYKLVTGVSPWDNSTVRENLNRHGLRILVTTSGRVGYFDFMTLLINLNVGAGLMGLTYILMDLLITQCCLPCCPLRGVYRQFKERRTLDMSDLRKVAAADPTLLARLQERFESDPWIVDPNPKILQALATGGTWEAEGVRSPPRQQEGSEARSLNAGRELLETPLLG